MYLPAGRLAGSNESPVSPAVEGARFTPFSRPATRFRLPGSFSDVDSGTIVSSAFKASFLGVLLWMAWCCFRLPFVVKPDNEMNDYHLHRKKERYLSHSLGT